MISMPPSSRPQWCTFDLRALVIDICRSLSRQISSPSVDVVIDIPTRQMITADGDMLRQAVANLVIHAIDTMPDGGSLVVTSSTGPNTVDLEIADSGPGLPEEMQHQSDGELYQTSSGTVDFGLAVVCRIAQLHGGKVTAANCPEGGAAFTLSIPRAVAVEKAA
jgi:signal transduction histidine kinase